MIKTLVIASAVTMPSLTGFVEGSEKGAKPELLPLKRVLVKQGAFIPGRGIVANITKEAWLARAGRFRFLFFDLDGDGKLQGEGEDGLAIDGFPFVVRLPKVLLRIGNAVRVFIIDYRNRDARRGQSTVARTLEALFPW